MAAKRKKIRLPPHRGQLPKVRALGQKWAPHEDLYHYIMTMSWWLYFFLAGLGFFLANAAFALLYTLQPGCILNARPGSFEDAFFFSVQTLATIGYGNLSPATRFGHIVVTFEALTGILGVALLTGVTFAKFARPRSRVLFSEKMVVAPRDGVPHLMFRVANFRHNQIVEAHLRVIVLVTEKTLEGDMLRRPLDLPLVRERNSAFVLSWLVLHRIDEHSPFYGPDAISRLRAAGAEIYLNLTGLDETIAQTINARYAYSLDDIVWNAHFADVMTVLPDGTRIIDYHHFHEVVPLLDSGTPFC